MTRPTAKFCSDQIRRLSALPYYGTLDPAGFKTLWEALQSVAESEEEAARAITMLLYDEARASNPETNRVPSPGEIRAWVSSLKPDRYEPTQPLGLCGNCEAGWVHEEREVDGRLISGVSKCVCQGGAAYPKPVEAGERRLLTPEELLALLPVRTKRDRGQLSRVPEVRGDALY